MVLSRELSGPVGAFGFMHLHGKAKEQNSDQLPLLGAEQSTSY